MLAAAVYLSWLGGKRLQELSQLNFTRGQNLEKQITSIHGFEPAFHGAHFNEFVIRCPDSKKLQKKLLHHGLQGGMTLDQRYPELKNCMLFGVTELHSDASMKHLLSVLKEGV